MMNRPLFPARASLLAGFVLLHCVVGVGRAAPADDLKRLLDQFNQAMQADRYQEAEDYGKRMLVLSEQVVLDRHDLRSTFHRLVADCYQRQERYAESLIYRERGLALAEQAYGRDDQQLTLVLDELGDDLWNHGKRDEAIPHYQRSLSIRERKLGTAHENTEIIRQVLASAYQQTERYADEEALRKRSLELAEKSRPRDEAEIARRLHWLGDCCWNQNRYEDAATLYTRALDIRRRVLGETHEETLFSLSELAGCLENLDRYDEAEQLRQAKVESLEKALGRDDDQVADALEGLGIFYNDRTRYNDSARAHERALAIRSKNWGTDDPDLADSLHGLSYVYFVLGRYAEAAKLDEQALALRQKHLEPDVEELAFSQTSLAGCYQVLGRYVEAEKLLKEALRIRQQTLGEQHGDYAFTLFKLGSLYRVRVRYAEGEAVLKRALAVYEQNPDEDGATTSLCLSELAYLYRDQGRYAEAEPLQRRALALTEQLYGEEDPDTALVMDGLATMLGEQGRLSESESLRAKAITLLEKKLGADSPRLADLLSNQAGLYLELDRYPESEELSLRALAIWEKAYGPEAPDLPYAQLNLASIYHKQGRAAETDTLLQRALAIREKSEGAEHPLTAEVLYLLAESYREQARGVEAEPLVDRALAILDRARFMPLLQLECVKLRAELAWDAGRKGEAISELRRAMDLAEQVRGQSSGTEHERAKSFARYADVFEAMIQRQTELGDVNEALMAMERSRARSLLDEMNLGGADVNIGRSSLEREELRQQEAALQAEISAIESELSTVDERESRERLQTRLALARGRLYDHHRNERSTSAVYRNLLAVGSGQLRLSQIQRRLQAHDALLLVYFFGEQGGYLLVASAADAQLLPLTLDADTAKEFSLDVGPLTEEKLQQILVREDRQGLVQQVAASAQREAPTDGLHTLWKLIVPEAQRQAVLSGQFKQLLVVPDGALSLLPFETLVVSPGKNSKYLLDEGPPILYGPSATVLHNLSQRPRGERQVERAVLTVGDPQYAIGDPLASDDENLTQRSRYGAAGGRLMRLPHSALEVGWVGEVFGKREIGVSELLQQDATEANVRREVSGRSIIHLACHGLTDQNYGNFFGALALTPGSEAASNSADDGFLTLAEIYSLDLRGCELAILSACETNYGPQQRGEGVWALSRGFLVAGARRVVASNWLVDDEAAANLVSVYCDEIARAEKQNQMPDYATSLQTAKRYIRKQEKWRSPYYWATFVLVGPN